MTSPHYTPSWKELTHRFNRPGRLEWIGVRVTRRAEVVALANTTALTGVGIEGDHKATRGTGGKRQVTLIQQEHLAVIAALLGIDEVAAALTRRNLVVSGINLLALRDQRFRIGGALLEGTGTCPPCSRMEMTLGSGALTAMRGHGGITAMVIGSGSLAVGDAVTFVGEAAHHIKSSGTS